MLPVLEDLKKLVEPNLDYNNTYIVSVQHLLETTGSLFEAIIDIGFKPQNIYLLGKVYSTHLETQKILKSKGINVQQNKENEKFGTLRENLKKDVSHLWEVIKPKLKEKDIVIILDDGGLAIDKVPKELFSICKFYAIEQTTFGLRYQGNIDNFPIIQVATSAAKKFLEPNLISRALFEKIHVFLKSLKPKNIGIIGFGHIGKSVAHLFNKKYKVFIYDINRATMQTNVGNLQICAQIKDLINNCDVIIGATGFDISNYLLESSIESDKTIISVSSSDIEFNSFLKKHNEELINNQFKILSNLIMQLPSKSKINIIRGGTVANFDGSKESCPKDQIQLTRGLLFAGIIQAINNLHNNSDKKGSVKLETSYQKMIVERWFSSNPLFKNYYPQTLIDNFTSEKWISENS